MNDDFDDYNLIDVAPVVSQLYADVSDEYRITSTNLDTSYLGERTLAVFTKLTDNFELYYADREIAGETEYDFFCRLQSTLNRNADTLERLLEVYDDDIANPVLGRTETITYNVTDTMTDDGTIIDTYNVTNDHDATNGSTVHNVDVPNDDPTYDRDTSRVINDVSEDVTDTQTGTVSNLRDLDQTNTRTGTVVTELSDLGVRPNYEMLNGFIDNNRTYIQVFLDLFKDCFSPRYQRIYA